MIINKFGGAIMADSKLAKLAVKQIKNQIKAGQRPIVVVSALKGITDLLVSLTDDYSQKVFNQICKKHNCWVKSLKLKTDDLKLKTQFLNLKKDLEKMQHKQGSKAIKDKILSYGERMSSLLFAELLRKNNIKAKRITDEELGIITDDNFGNANIDYKRSVKNIRKECQMLTSFSPETGLKARSQIFKVPVITGFIAKTVDSQTTTLGRGGSDTTACLIGAALNVLKVVLWKNVPGVLSADPRIVKNPKTVDYLTYEEAEESGKVVHSKSMALVQKENITVEVAYIKDPSQKTVINAKEKSKKGVKIISSKENLKLLQITGEQIKHYGALVQISRIITDQKINMVLIRNTRDNLYIVVDKNAHDLAQCKHQIKELNYQLKTQDVSMVYLIGKLDWCLVEKFNHWLHKICPKAILGAFPYKNCVRLESIILASSKANKLIRKFHQEFI